MYVCMTEWGGQDEQGPLGHCPGLYREEAEYPGPALRSVPGEHRRSLVSVSQGREGTKEASLEEAELSWPMVGHRRGYPRHALFPMCGFGVRLQASMVPGARTGLWRAGHWWKP